MSRSGEGSPGDGGYEKARDRKFCVTSMGSFARAAYTHASLSLPAGKGRDDIFHRRERVKNITGLRNRVPSPTSVCLQSPLTTKLTVIEFQSLQYIGFLFDL
jgi:hypothetical protein